jgi:hypothetical protein
MQLIRRRRCLRHGHALAASIDFSGLVWAFRIHRRRSKLDRPADPFSHDGLLWLHFNLADARAAG